MRTLTTCLLLLLPGAVFGADLRGVVERVIDGDTFDLCNDRGEPFRIRLSGIDAPEISQASGRESRNYLAGLVEGKRVVVVWSKKDVYGRPLGTVLLGSLNVNTSQIQAGYAWYFKRYAVDIPEIERLQYEAAEGEAREARRGLWQQQAMPPWEWRRRSTKASTARALLRVRPSTSRNPLRRAGRPSPLLFR